PGWNRRQFLAGLTRAGTGGLLGFAPTPARAEPPPETTRLRLVGGRALCYAPQFVAEELLHGEGFSDVEYVLEEPSAAVLGANKRDLSLASARISSYTSTPASRS